ncbi:transcriptional regulator [Sphingomonas aerolata]|uniref:Transcriptional regulator n=1 Tax=Sphingomonas aerolata TaxID=185951 RepID=A0A2T4YMQ4_9SPHN|nr:transcriptional regulator [Sphingomonas aerolata]PTM44682.1 transcriptional regulator [Sphingomonas aerolata]
MGAERLDLLIHPPVRLQLMALLADVSEMEFGTARDILGVSDSVLSKHLAQLSDGEYIELRKATVNTRQRTWIVGTAAGRKAFKGHVAALQALASGRVPSTA